MDNITFQAITQISFGLILLFFGQWFININKKHLNYLFNKTNIKFYERVLLGFNASHIKYILLSVGAFLLCRGIVTLISQ
jgi:hypothetical protein